MTRAPALRRLFHRILILGACAFIVTTIGGCDQAPTGEALTADLTAYVENGYAPGLLEITHVERLKDSILPEFGSDRRTVSFAAYLRLTRDHDFGAWDHANAATLMLLLGARAPSLHGLKAGGNKAGDVIHVTGAVIYKATDQGWRLDGSVAPAPSSESVSNLQGRIAVLAQWRRFTAMTFRALLSPSGVLSEDLGGAVKTAAARLARKDGGLVVASGPLGGNYWTVTQAVSNVSTNINAGIKAGAKPKVAAPASAAPVINVATQGSRENLRLLREGAVTAVLLRSDEAAFAARGEGPFASDGTFPGLRAVAGLFPEQVHVVVMGASPIASVAELYGRRVAVATGGLAALTVAGDILRSHRVELTALVDAADQRSADDALAALAEGERDAVILTSAAPDSTLRNFSVSHAVRLLPLDADAVALLTTGNSSYVAVRVPAQTYPGQIRPIATVGVTALLASSSAVPAADVEALVGRMFAEIDFMDQGSPFSALVKRTSADRGLTLPLHDGAVAFYATPVSQK